MEYDIVLATRNRPAAVRLSLPLMLLQTKPAASVFVIDSSDNHCVVRQTVDQVVRSTGFPANRLSVVQAPPGIPRQRNVGLKYVTSPVVMFPDDDSLWYPETAQVIVGIYEEDVKCEIGGVCGVDVSVSPLEGAGDLPYRMELSVTARQYLVRLTSPVRRRLAPDPLYSMESSPVYSTEPPPWLRRVNGTVCGPMSGFKMSFRADVIRSVGFDERLAEYALSEDIDASLGVMRTHWLACAKEAKVYHHRFPGARAGDREFGMMQALNRTYIVCKHNDPGSIARRRLKKFLYVKALIYLLQSYSIAGRARLRGFWAGLRACDDLLDAASTCLGARFEARRDEVMGRSPVS